MFSGSLVVQQAKIPVPQKVILTKKIEHKENNPELKSCGKAKGNKIATYQRNLKKFP